jgi:hypothetical protein|tara:strand:+ start:246 stop:506 length:261 start_codon:yes stop_codon:yes gene_type:complete
MDDITKAITGAYRNMQETGVASAKNSNDLRKALPKDEAKMSENTEFRSAFMEMINRKDYKPTIGEDSGPEKEINQDLLSKYLKNIS